MSLRKTFRPELMQEDVVLTAQELISFAPSSANPVIKAHTALPIVELAQSNKENAQFLQFYHDLKRGTTLNHQKYLGFSQEDFLQLGYEIEVKNAGQVTEQVKQQILSGIKNSLGIEDDNEALNLILSHSQGPAGHVPSRMLMAYDSDANDLFSNLSIKSTWTIKYVIVDAENFNDANYTSNTFIIIKKNNDYALLYKNYRNEIEELDIASIIPNYKKIIKSELSKDQRDRELYGEDEITNHLHNYKILFEQRLNYSYDKKKKQFYYECIHEELPIEDPANDEVIGVVGPATSRWQMTKEKNGFSLMGVATKDPLVEHIIKGNLYTKEMVEERRYPSFWSHLKNNLSSLLSSSFLVAQTAAVGGAAIGGTMAAAGMIATAGGSLAAIGIGYGIGFVIGGAYGLVSGVAGLYSEYRENTKPYKEMTQKEHTEKNTQKKRYSRSPSRSPSPSIRPNVSPSTFNPSKGATVPPTISLTQSVAAQTTQTPSATTIPGQPPVQTLTRARIDQILEKKRPYTTQGHSASGPTPTNQDPFGSGITSLSYKGK